MIYYIINTQYMNKFLSESTCELLPQYYSRAHPGRTSSQMCIQPDSHLSYSIFNGKNSTFQSTLSF